VTGAGGAVGVGGEEGGKSEGLGGVGVGGCGVVGGIGFGACRKGTPVLMGVSITVLGGAVYVLGLAGGSEGGLGGTVGRREALSLASVSAASVQGSAWLGACCDDPVDYFQQSSCVAVR